MRTVRILQGACYAVSGAFAHPLRFVRQVFGDAAEPDGSLDHARQLISDARARLVADAAASPLDQRGAAARLQLRDLDLLARTVETSIHAVDLDEERLHACFRKLQHLLEAEGVSLGGARLSVRPAFPAPYRELDFWAMNYDISDHEAYGIDIGVVLKRDYVMPVYSPVLLAHELLHTAVGQVRTDHLARGFEEGLADVVGTLHLGSKLLPWNVCENVLINSRLPHPRNHFLRDYAHSLRQALVFYLAVGWDGVMELIRTANRQGRGVIKRLERSLIEGHAPACPTARSERPDLSRFARRFLAFPAHMVVSPLSYLLAERLKLGMTLSELFGGLGVAPALGEEALRELERRAFLVVVSDGKITADETKPFIEAQVLRYEV